MFRRRKTEVSTPSALFRLLHDFHWALPWDFPSAPVCFLEYKLCDKVTQNDAGTFTKALKG